MICLLRKESLYDSCLGQENDFLSKVYTINFSGIFVMFNIFITRISRIIMGVKILFYSQRNVVKNFCYVVMLKSFGV